ncbi:hypothetical protein Gotur_027654 [Gossypium turneri]
MAIHNEETPEMTNLATFLKWFYPLEHWADMLMFEFLKNTRVQWIINKIIPSEICPQKPHKHHGMFN